MVINMARCFRFCVAFKIIVTSSALNTAAELLGEKELKRDIGTRLFKFRGDINAELNHYHPHGALIVNAFVEGINAYIREMRQHPEQLPFEFKVLNTLPDYWTPEIVISRHQGLLGNVKEELKNARIVHLAGADKLRELQWFHPVSAPNEPNLTLDKAINGEALFQPILELYEAFRAPLDFKKDDKKVGLAPPFDFETWYEEEKANVGSNNWIISGKHSQSGYPMLANDPHRAQSVPSLRYWVHLHAPGWNVVGAGEPTLPGVSVGHNEVASWGLTIFETDNEDLYVRSATDGSDVMELEKANISEWEKAGWRMPEVFTAKGRDGKTDIWGIIIRPTNFDPNKKYPVIENIYAGPHSSFTPKSFMTYNRSMFELAELGFIVVQLDGMGTSNRSKAFHDVCWKNLKDAGFPDRILWMQEAARKYASFDISRVGIYGTSAGGQSSTGGLLFYPDFYKVGVSSCGCHDNRMDKIWWNEQWMGYPIGPHYAECSNVTNADKLQGKLLLILGEVDDNVDPASTMQLVNALIKSNKDFDFVMVPNMAHSNGGDYGERKRRDFFVRHLLGVQPPAWTLPLATTGGGK
jgi:hypothetical protein